jgi:hypothetical protein
VAKPTEVTVPVPAGKSAATKERNVGVAATPDVGPANTRFADWVFKVKDSAGVVVGVATDVVNSGERLPEEKEDTVPEPPPPETVDQYVTPLTPFVVSTCPAVPGLGGRINDQFCSAPEYIVV